MSTIKEVAARAGVSVTTVSRFLNDRGYISQEMRKRISDAMGELNYHPNEVARSLSKQRTNIIGVLVPLVSNPFWAEVVEALAQTIQRRGYRMMLYTSTQANDTAVGYINMLKANQVDGIIVGLRGEAIAQELSDDLPVVSFERLKVGELPTVLCDNAEGGRMAARELLACGCRCPAMLGAFYSRQIPAYERLTGFREELKAHGVEPRDIEGLDAEYGNHYPELVEAAIERYPEVDGFFCSSDLMAAKLIQGLERAGKRVPEDVQVIGFNGNHFAQDITPALTTLRQPIEAMCETAVALLEKQIAGEKVPMEHIFPLTLDRRASTKPPAED